MLSDFYLHIYVTAIGFVTAGLLASSSQLVTGHPLGFTIGERASVLASILSVVTRVIAGPVILLRNALRGRLIEGRALYWLAMSMVVATVWSFFSGVVVLETFVTLSPAG